MYGDQLKAKWDARVKAVTEQRSLYAAAEGRELTAEEKATDERLNADIDRLDKQIQTGMAEFEREQRSAEAMSRYEALTRTKVEAPDQARDVRTELRSQLLRVATGDPVDAEYRGLNANGHRVDGKAVEVRLVPEDMRTRLTGPYKQPKYERRDLGQGAVQGTITVQVPVPSQFVSSLYEVLLDTSTLRPANPTVVTTSGGNAIDYPRATAHGNVAWLAEAAALAENDPTLSKITLNAFKVGALVQVSTELLQDEGFDVIDYLSRHGGENIAIATDAEYVNGTNPTTRPSGIFPNATVGQQMVTGNTTSFTTAGSVDNLFDVFHSVGPRYRLRGSWLMNDSLVKIVRKLKDTTNQYLWQPGLALGLPDTLLGRPVYIDPNVPSPVGASNKVAAFGDFRGYVIREVGSVRFERSDEYAFNADLVTFRVVWRTDGKLIDTNAVKLLQNSAT